MTENTSRTSLYLQLGCDYLAGYRLRRLIMISGAICGVAALLLGTLAPKLVSPNRHRRGVIERWTLLRLAHRRRRGPVSHHELGRHHHRHHGRSVGGCGSGPQTRTQVSRRPTSPGVDPEVDAPWGTDQPHRTSDHRSGDPLHGWARPAGSRARRLGPSRRRRDRRRTRSYVPPRNRARRPGQTQTAAVIRRTHPQIRCRAEAWSSRWECHMRRPKKAEP